MSDEKRGIGDVRWQIGMAKTRIAFGNAFRNLGSSLRGRPVQQRNACPHCGMYNDANALQCRLCGKELNI